MLLEIDIIVALHVFGAVLGMGAALMGDLVFLTSAKDKIFSHDEMRLMNAIGNAVWLGLTVLAVSGLLLFFRDPSAYLVSSKFIAKMVVVLIITLNGIVLHAYHMKHLKGVLGVHFPGDKNFMKNANLMAIGGVISVVSWFTALTLGVSSGSSFSALNILLIYLAVILSGTVAVYFLKREFLRRK
jgi:hypothetical protein